MGKRNAVAASNATLPYAGPSPYKLQPAEGDQARPMAIDAVGHRLPKGSSSKHERTLLGLPGRTLLGLSKTLPAALRSVWSSQPAAEDRESSLAGLSAQVEAKRRKPRAAARLKPPAPPPGSFNSDWPRSPGHSADATDHDVQFIEVFARPPQPVAKRSAVSRKAGKRSRLVPIALGGVLALAAGAYVVQSRPEVLGATKSAWQELESSARQRFETTTSAASPTSSVAPAAEAAKEGSEPLASSSESAVSKTPVADTGATAKRAPKKIGGSSAIAKKSRRRIRARHRKVDNTPW